MTNANSTSTFLSQPSRAVAALIYTVAIILISRTLTGEWIPSGGRVLWLASGVALWSFTLLAAPYFRPPRGSFGSGLAAALLLATVDLEPVTQLHGALNGFRWFAFALATLTSATANHLPFDGNPAV